MHPQVASYMFFIEQDCYKRYLRNALSFSTT